MGEMAKRHRLLLAQLLDNAGVSRWRLASSLLDNADVGTPRLCCNALLVSRACTAGTNCVLLTVGRWLLCCRLAS